MEMEQEVIHHREPNSIYEWLEYPQIMVTTKATEELYQLAVINKLKDQPQLSKEIIDLYENDITLAKEVYVKIEVLRDSVGHLLDVKHDITETKPTGLDAHKYNHTLTFFSNDKAYLDFIKWDIKKKLDERLQLENMGLNIEHADRNVATGILSSPNELNCNTKIEHNEPSFKINKLPTRNEHGKIDLPTFLKGVQKKQSFWDKINPFKKKAPEKHVIFSQEFDNAEDFEKTINALIELFSE